MCHRTQDQRLLQTSPWDRDEAMEDGCNTSLDVGTNSLTMGISACLWLRMQFAPDSPGDRGPDKSYVGKMVLLNAHAQLLARGKKEVENVKIRTSERKQRKQRE